MNNFLPWYVSTLSVWLFGAVIWSYAGRPITWHDAFLVSMIGTCLIFIVRGYFQMNAIFNRIENRDQEWNK